MAATPNRCVRVPDDIWQAAHETAREHGRTLSAVICDLLTIYVEGADAPGEEQPA